MSLPLESYALLGDLRTGPLLSREGSIDWLCFPRFDSDAIFSSILGGPGDGRWQLSIVEGTVTSRRYVGASFVVETMWTTPDGKAVTTDFMPSADSTSDVVRMVRCTEGEVTVQHDLRLRLNYGRAVPWLRPWGFGLMATAGPDGLLVSGPGMADCSSTDRAKHDHLTPSLRLRAGETADWQLIWFPSHEQPPGPVDATRALRRTLAYWGQWAAGVKASGPFEAEVRRSLLVLRALTHSGTGGIVAAPTTSLPEEFGGSRNWDYRYTWLRDAALTIEALVAHGGAGAAYDWRDWLLRAVAGDVGQLQIMYGLSGERDLAEREIDNLAGYEGSRPVRVGNAAVDQFQADVVGEVMLALGRLRETGVEEDDYSWALQRRLLDYTEQNFDRKDHGIWEMRGDEHYFTHGRVMMWAAFDQGIKAVETYGLDGPADHWRRLRDRLADEIETRGVSAERGCFTQTYDGDEVDASLLQIPHTGFCDYTDERMLATVAAIEADLSEENGFIHRYRTSTGVDGLEGEEYPFLICVFWLVEQYARSGRREDAEQLMERLLACANDVGLLSEEYDPLTGRLAGNFPQAFSHLGLIRAADALEQAAEDDAGVARLAAQGPPGTS